MNILPVGLSPNFGCQNQSLDLPLEIHPIILSNMTLEDLFTMKILNKYFYELVSKIPIVHGSMNPFIITVAADAAIGSNKIIFCLTNFQSNDTSRYDHIVLNYDKPFTFKKKSFLGDKKGNYSRVKWYKNFSYTNRYDNNKRIIRLYHKGCIINGINGINICEPHQLTLMYHDIDKIMLSNGDIVFNYYDGNNIDLCVIFTRNNPQIKFYQSTKNIDSSEELDEDSDNDIFHHNFKTSLVDEYISNIETNYKLIEINDDSKHFY
jgi:hypothetical protein